MNVTLDISDELQARVEAIAQRSGLSASQVIADALDKGHSLDWQEQFLDKVAAGMEAAERGDFAGDDEIAQVLNKYRPA
nr:transcriptional regulator [uncultured Devosia sp.]